MKARELLAPVIAILASAAVLLGASAVLRPVAERNETAARDEIMGYMLPTRPGAFTEEPYDGEDESIRRVFKAEGGYVVEVETAGYVGPMILWVGVTNDGQVSGVTVRDHRETFGLGRGAQTEWPFLIQFLGTAGEAAVGDGIDALTGATVTSKAVTRAVNSAAAFVTGADVSSGATEWEG
jgi:electron transport complex protein RnfG